MNAREWIAGTLRFTDADTIPTPRRVLEELAATPMQADAPPDHGTAAGGDFSIRDLMARYSRSASWVRARLAAGDFGKPYHHGRDRIAPRAGVLQYDARQRENVVEDEEPAAPSRDRGLSLVERRRRAA